MPVALMIPENFTDKERRIALGRAVIRQCETESARKAAAASGNLKQFKHASIAARKARDLADAWQAVQISEVTA